jgi:opacity protein-like surface antigen
MLHRTPLVKFMHRNGGIPVAALLVVLSITATAGAQSPGIPKFELAGGYASMRDLDADQNVPGGRFVSAERNYNPWLGIVVEVSASGVNTTHIAPLPDIVDPRTGMVLVTSPAIDTRWRTAAFLVGPTFSYRHTHHLVLFGRILVGLASVSDSANIQPAHAAGTSVPGIESGTESSAAAGLQPGAGVDIAVSRRVGVRVAADYRSLLGIGTSSGATASELWLRAGLVIAFGTR